MQISSSNPFAVASHKASNRFITVVGRCVPTKGHHLLNLAQVNMDFDLGNGNPQSGEWNAEFNTNDTSSDVNKTVTASQFIAGFYALLFYLVLLIFSILGVCFRACVKMFSSRATSLLFLIGTMLACVNVLCNSDNLEVRVYFRLPTAFLVGIVFVLAGAVFFFSKPEEVANQTTLARQQPSMGLVVGVISIPLIIVEIFLLAAASASKNKSDPEPLPPKSWALVVADKTTFLVQKVVQAIVYILLLRYRTICPRYKENAKFYLKTLAFFNFIEWVDSQVNEDTDIKLSHTNLSYNAWFDILTVFYKALIIDYRLLCSLLFLEHSLEDEMADNYDEVNDTPNRNMTLKKEQYRAAGFIFGFLSLSAPICTALYYVKNLNIPPWVHVFAIIINFTIVGCGAVFLSSNDLTGDRERHPESSGVQNMVGSHLCWLCSLTSFNHCANLDLRV